MRRIARLAASVALVLPLALSGCATSSGGCPDFVSYDTPADAVADVQAVVVGTVGDKVGTTPMFAGAANVWTVDVDRWVKGDGDARIEVISTPPQCSGDDLYFGADPFATAVGPQAMFLYDEGGRWRTITPMQGVVPAVDGGVPSGWPTAPPVPEPPPGP